MSDTDMPDHSARGITRSECVDGEDIRRCVFTFDRIKSLNRKELSIQWLDNRDAEHQMKSRMKDDHPQFILGFAVMKTADLERLRNLERYRGMDYIRSPSSDKMYHGLITVPYVMHDRELAAELALIAEKYEFDQELPVG